MPEPVPGPGEARLRLVQCGICGSDLHVYRGEWSIEGKIGHEICGVVDQIGEGVDGWPLGTRVCAECFAHCGHCRYCRQGDYNLCESVSFLGGLEHSGLAEKAVLPAHTLHKAPASFSDAEVMMVEPLAVAFRAVSRARVAADTNIGIVGAGTIGLLCTAVAKAVGASAICVAAKHPHQAAKARELGAEEVVLMGKQSPVEAMRALSGGRGLDAAIDTVACGTSFSTALAAVRNQGRVVVLGGITRSLLATLGHLVDGEVEVTGSQCYAITQGKRDFAWAIELIERGRVNAAELVTHTLPFESVGEAFRVANDKSTGSIKVAVRIAD